MESKVDFRNLTMDEIVFDSRNKNYGAFALRRIYEKHLMKALAITVSCFIFSMYTPKIVKSLGLFADKPEEVLDTTSIVLQAPPSIKPDEPPPPPPPPVEEVLRPTARFLEMEAVKKEEVEEPPPPTIEELENKDIGNKNIDAPETNEPPPIVETVTGGDGIDHNRVYEKVEQMPEFVGGQEKLNEYIDDNLDYPDQEESDGVTGRVRVFLVVNDDGKVSDVRIAQTSGNKNLDAEALRVIKGLMNSKSAPFKPGRQNGVAVRVLCVIPIDFLNEDE